LRRPLCLNVVIASIKPDELALGATFQIGSPTDRQRPVSPRIRSRFASKLLVVRGAVFCRGLMDPSGDRIDPAGPQGQWIQDS
jgi:hypothetical protein